MAKGEVTVCKVFSFDASHQLVGHFGKCANLHGHTYKLEVKLREVPTKVELTEQDVMQGCLDEDDWKAMVSSEGFVMDFYHFKTIVNQLIVDKMDHAFLAKGDEPALDVLRESGSKVVVLGFRTTVENMASYICWRLLKAGLPVYSVRMWETPTGWAEVLAEDIDIETGPKFRTIGGCDLD